MSFDLNILAQSTGKCIQITDQHNGTMIEIHARGALMNRWMVKNKDQDLELILGNLNAADFEMNGFRSGKMSPFSCRIDGGIYQWQAQTYQFEKFYLGAHAMHGLVYDADFKILTTAVQDHHAMATLSFEYQGTDPGFPFPFDIAVQWTLHQDNLVAVKTTIINQSKIAIPLMDGWHPYFTLGGIVDDYILEFQTNGKLEMRQDMIPTGKMVKESNFEKGLKIGKAHFGDCYLLDPIHNKIKLSHQGNVIEIQPKQHYPYLQIYTPDDRQSIAIENLSGAPNCFNNKMGLQQLEPQHQIYFETTYQFSAASQL